jgi:TetR/AcrR family transcriptional regulator, mexJK operon transcriptional repressor
MMNSTKVKAAKKRARGRPRPEEVPAIENRLLTIALEEFLQHGYGGASLNRIIKTAGVSKTTLYSRFSSKEELFRAIIYEQIEALAPDKALRSSGAKQPGLKEGLIAYANFMLERSLKGDMLGVNRLILAESHRFPELGVTAMERTEMGVRRVSGFIRECAVLDGVPCQDPDGVAEAFVFMLRGWYLNTMVTGRRVSPRQRERWVERAVNALLCSREGW